MPVEYAVRVGGRFSASRTGPDQILSRSLNGIIYTTPTKAGSGSYEAIPDLSYESEIQDAEQVLIEHR